MTVAPESKPVLTKRPSKPAPLFDARTILFLAVGTVMFLVLLWSVRHRPGAGVPTDRAALKDYANALVDAQLYDDAAGEYEKVLRSGSLDSDQQANISLVIADLYMDNAHDYAKALVWYLRVKHLYPRSPLADKVGPKIVECLERLGRSNEAELELEAQTKLAKDKPSTPQGKVVVARIGNRKITMDEMNQQLDRLPAPVRQQFEDPSKKLQYLQQYVATELLADKAKRLNFDKDPEVVADTEQAKKSFMVQKLLKQEVTDAVKIDPDEMKLYYDAHKDRYRKVKNGKVVGQETLLEAKNEVEADLRRDREQQLQQQLLQQLMKSEDVQIYSDLFPGGGKAAAKGAPSK